MGDLSEKACSSCGEHHRLDEFKPGARVTYAVRKSRRWNPLINVGEVGTVVEWSQQYSPLYYRVQFANGERENFDPCELRLS